jgi:hypothetical protein
MDDEETEYILKLDSTTANGLSHDFTVAYPNLELTGRWDVALVSLFGWYSYKNISAAIGNNLIRYSTDSGGTWETNITIPDGIYNVEDLNAYMKSVMKTRGDYAPGATEAEDVYYISLEANYNTLRCDCIISGGYQIDFTAGTLHELLGFNSAIITATQQGENKVDITNGVNSLEVRLDITSGGWSNSYQGGILGSFIPNVRPGANIVYMPSPIIHLKVNKQIISSINVKIRDQLNRPVVFDGEPITIIIHLRKRQ